MYNESTDSNYSISLEENESIFEMEINNCELIKNNILNSTFKESSDNI